MALGVGDRLAPLGLGLAHWRRRPVCRSARRAGKQPRQKLSRRIATWLTEIEPLMLALALPTLVLPASYLWRAQRGLNAYDGLGDPALAWPSHR